MTHAEQILRAVAALTQSGKIVFARKDIRDQIGVSDDEWMSGYTAVFQGMRADHPGGAPQVGHEFKGVFRRVEFGQYALTEYGEGLVGGSRK